MFLFNNGSDLGIAEQKTFQRLITERTGIVLLDHQLNNLQTTIEKACLRFGYNSSSDYLRKLRDEVSLSPEFEFLIDAITVGESYFFRDVAQMELLKGNLLPEIIARKRQEKDYSLRIWSAGCSNGQEIYSLVIMLHELLPDIKDWTLHFLATDINTEVLANAIRGHFREWSFRATSTELKNKYFTPVDQEYALDKRLCECVKFTYLNLSEDIFPSILSQTHALDLILCRNVFIYIEPKTIQLIMNRFSNCLVNGGILLLGPSDHISGSIKDLNHVQRGGTSYFKKVSALPDVNEGLWPISVSLENSEPLIDFTAATHTVKQPNDVLNVVAQETHSTKKAQEYSGLKLFDQIIQMLREELWTDVLEVIKQAENEQGTSADLWQIKANALANLGLLDESLQACQQSLALDPCDKHTYLIQGIVYIEQNQQQLAEIALRKAIYLDHTFAEAHYHLGLLLLRVSKPDAGLKSLTNALALVEQGDPQRELHNALGMVYSRFAEILRNEISIYK